MRRTGGMPRSTAAANRSAHASRCVAAPAVALDRHGGVGWLGVGQLGDGPQPRLVRARHLVAAEQPHGDPGAVTTAELGEGVRSVGAQRSEDDAFLVVSGRGRRCILQQLLQLGAPCLLGGGAGVRQPVVVVVDPEQRRSDRVGRQLLVPMAIGQLVDGGHGDSGVVGGRSVLVGGWGAGLDRVPTTARDCAQAASAASPQRSRSPSRRRPARTVPTRARTTR